MNVKGPNYTGTHVYIHTIVYIRTTYIYHLYAVVLATNVTFYT